MIDDSLDGLSDVRSEVRGKWAPRNKTWFDDKVCTCRSFRYRKEDYRWPEEPDWDQPPTCGACGKLDRNRVFECRQCGQAFYQWFSHPKSGFYHDRRNNPVGWYCYSCLENNPPTGMTLSWKRYKTKVEPIPGLIPPDFVHAEKTVLPAESQRKLDDFLRRLKGL